MTVEAIQKGIARHFQIPLIHRYKTMKAANVNTIATTTHAIALAQWKAAPTLYAPARRFGQRGPVEQGRLTSFMLELGVSDCLTTH
jgi:hypothetical protein